MIDFELSAFNALKLMFPNIKQNGSNYFNSIQSVLLNKV